MRSASCNESAKVIGSMFQSFWFWLRGWQSPTVFIVVYPPLEEAEQIRFNPDLYNPLDWLREDKEFDWYYQALFVADQANLQANKIVAIICELPREDVFLLHTNRF